MKNLLSKYYIRNAEGKFLYYCHTTGSTYFCNDIEQAESFNVYEHALAEIRSSQYLEIVQVQLVIVRPLCPKRSIPQGLRETWQRMRRLVQPEHPWKQQLLLNKRIIDTNDAIADNLAAHNRRLDLLENQIYELQNKK